VILRLGQAARVIILALVAISTPIEAQQSTDAGQSPKSINESGIESGIESLVLVLNLISSTHARPTTGIVLAREEGTDQSATNSLVLVSADFVHEGDEIIVLDGGSDIDRNGRTTRTIARSAESGLALLEVDGLLRPGITLSAENWPGAADAKYRLAAWPNAAALVAGASLLQESFEPQDISSLPQVTGPVFDSCDNLAAFHIYTDAARLVNVEAVGAFLETWDIQVRQSSCYAPPGAADAENSELDEALPAEVPGQEQGTSSSETGSDQSLDMVPEDQLSTLGLTSAQKRSVVIAWVVLGILAMFLYVRRQKKKEGQFIVLERHDEERRFTHRFRLDPKTGGQSGRRTGGQSGGHAGSQSTAQEMSYESRFERQGHSVIFSLNKQGLSVSQPEVESSDTLELSVAGTPCLPGEVFLIAIGQRIQLADETFTVNLESIGPARVQADQ